MKYISIDGDDIGRKISLFYLDNDEDGLRDFSLALEEITKRISSYLLDKGFNILFCAADGVTASKADELSFGSIFSSIQELSTNGISFSAGVGDSLRESYVALLAAKSSGKGRIYFYSDLRS